MQAAEYTLGQNLKPTKNLNLNLNLTNTKVRVRVSFKFCPSCVLRWAKISLAHFSGRTRSYLVEDKMVAGDVGHARNYG